MRTWLARRVVVVLSLVAVFALGGSVVLAAIPGSGGTIYACYAKTTGAVRVVNYPTVHCASSEKMLALASAGTTTSTRHVDGSLVVLSTGGYQFIARLEVRTTPSGEVQFGYMELYGINTPVGGKIIQFTISHVDYYMTASGAMGARFSDSQECRMTPWEPCFPSGYYMTDGSAVGQPDTFLGDWVIQKGDISIYTTSGQNTQ
jgi:hypothetical protein